MSRRTSFTITSRARGTPQILRAHLTEPGNDAFQFTAYAAIGQLNPGAIFLEPSRDTIITELPGIGVQISDWIRNRTVEITTSGPGEIVRTVPWIFFITRRSVLRCDNQAFIVGLRLVGDHIILFKPICVELHLIPPFTSADGQPILENNTRLYRFHLQYSYHRFTGASLSEPQPNPESLGDSRIVYVLAQSAYAGFFYFRVTIHNPEYVPSGPGARMDIDLVGVYEVGLEAELGPCLAWRSWLGPEGKRGVWTKRPLDAATNVVVAVSFDQSYSEAVPVESGDDLQELCEIAPRIKSIGDIYIAKSRNFLLDPILQCSFSEATGKIVLLMRNNRIMIL